MRDNLKKLKDLLETKFSRKSTIVDVYPGYRDNIHLMVISKVFNKKKENNRQNMIWGFLDEFVDEKKITKKELSKISLLTTISIEDLKRRIW